ncbi:MULTISPECIES: hypothetical protein [Rufibacter]|uniref:Uncharacterized protein n=1 Tax=Rufibacter quisquiliarum TaxID=1549639 RepID=A0A839GAU0_9BACT|nr:MULTISPECIES: hypothetical protein [Rufibacter]MBA9075410.1 hypothetical protein [Rufibacter quisquiliarum]
MEENLYPNGAEVYAKTNPEVKLVVRRYAKRVYYCTEPGKPTQSDKVFYERELMVR